MAGDWIKMRTNLAEDPAVIGMSQALEIDEDAIVGRLHRLWSWADQHTTDGSCAHIDFRWIDKYVRQPGFAEALAKAGWLEQSGTGIVLPGFDKHNGTTAKRRLEGALRQRASRERNARVTERSLIPRRFVKAVYERDNYRCVFCGGTSSPEGEKGRHPRLSVDHLRPESRGGPTVMENLVTCCRRCNMEKTDRTPEEWDMPLDFLADGLEYRNGSVTAMSQNTVTSALPREEKRREEETTTPYSPPSDLLEDPPLGIGGAGPPPDRRPVVLVSETAEHLTALGKAWNDAQRAKKGDDIIFMPEGDRLGRLIAQKIIEAGIPLADILRFDAETMRRSMTHWRAHQAEQAQSNPTAKRYRWGLGYLASGWIDQCEAMRAKDKRADRAEADKNKLAVDLAAQKAAVDERAAMDAAWGKLTPAEQRAVLEAYREAHGPVGVKTAAIAAWWQEQQKGGE